MIAHPLRIHRIAYGVSLASAFCCAATLPELVHAQQLDSIIWRDDYASAFEEARSSDRLLWVQFTGPWCPNCTRMERDTLGMPAIVGHAQKSFVAVKLRSDTHEQLALAFNLSGLPATVLVAPNREILATHQGYLSPVELDGLLRGVLSRWPCKPPGANERPADQKERAALHRASPDQKDEQRLTLSGYCPVTLVRERKLVAGQPACVVEHEGRLYRLASPALVELFRKDPDRYAPRIDGSCPVNRLDRGRMQPGSPKWGVIYRGRLFLCAAEEDRRRFLSDPERYASVDAAD